MAIKFNVEISRTGNESADIVSGELSVHRVLAGDPIDEVLNVAKDQMVVEGLVGDDGSQVDLSFVWIDDAGNRSTNPSTLTAILADTIPPTDPGSLGITVVGEE